MSTTSPFAITSLSLGVRKTLNQTATMHPPPPHLFLNSPAVHANVVSGAYSEDVIAKMQQMKLDDTTRRRLESFLEQKQRVGGLLQAEDLDKLGELGAGNGGVVVKVRHKPTGIIMARKVRRGVGDVSGSVE